jgi:phosphate transport system permease protein
MENRSRMTNTTQIQRGSGKSAPSVFIADRNFRTIVLVCVIIVSVLLLAFTVSLIVASLPSILQFGFKFFTGTTWDPLSGEFGVLPFIIGSLITSLLALAISIPFSISTAIFLGEYFRGGPVSGFLNTAMELLAGIPSIIYGMWGLFMLVPIVRVLQTSMSLPPYGVGVFTASLLLSIMIIPYAASISREVINMVPQDLKEAAYSLGATRYEVVKKVILPYSSSGIFAGILLSFGRALGETMAVTMVIGNMNSIPTGLFAPGNTISSLIANEFTEASDPMYVSALIEAGLILFIITMVFGVLGRFIINKTQVKS